MQILSSRGISSNLCSPNLQKFVRNPWKPQNSWRISLNEPIFNENAVLPHAALKTQGKWT